MKKFLMLLLIVFIYTVSAQDFDSDDCYGLKSIERHYQILLKRWREGANGNGQGRLVDSVVLCDVARSVLRTDTLVKRYGDVMKNTPKELKVYEDVQHYKGLSIFHKGGSNIPTTTKVLKEYYNIDIEGLKNFDTWNIGVERVYGTPKYTLVCVNGLPEDERVFYLVSNITGEVLSTYKDKIKKTSPLKGNECVGKDFIFMEYLGPDSVKITEF